MNAIEKYNNLENIKKLVLSNKHLMVDDIVEVLNISYPTARRYIQELIKNDKDFCKIRNGISIVNYHNQYERYFEEKLSIHFEEKKAIAKKCASLISDNDSILIDSGTSCYFLSKELYQENLKVVTTDLKISMELSNKKNISLYNIGGEIRKGYYSIGGLIASENIKKFNVNISIMSADSIDMDIGITNADMFEVPIKQEIRRCSNKLILIADSSKFDKKSFYFVMPISDIDVIITDSNISENNIKLIKENNIKLIIV